MKRLNKIPTSLFILLMAALLFLPFLGHVHLFDWDEINFAESAREMLISQNIWRVQIDYMPFWEKPPLFIWMQAISMKLLGVNELAARLPNAICGILTLLILYFIGRRLYDRLFGVLWTLAFAGSFLPHFYFKSGIIDPFFNLFIFLGIYFFSTLSFETEFIDRKGNRRRRNQSLILSGLFIGLAVLTKGPVALLIIAAAIFLYFLLSRAKQLIGLQEFLIWFLIIVIVTFTWFGFETVENGPWFIKEFFRYQIRLLRTFDAGHSGPFYYHFLVLLIGCFPASVLIFSSFRKQTFDNPSQHNFKRWMTALLIIILLIFSIVQTKIIHYSSMAYFPITFLAAYFVYGLLQGTFKWRWWNTLLILVPGILFAIAMAVLPIVGNRIDMILPFVNDPFAVENLNATVYWSDYEAIIGLIYLLILITVVVLVHLKKYRAGIFLLFQGTAIFIFITISLVVPKIEKYSQHATIEFYKSKIEEDCYIQVLGFKSYAHLFYSRKKPVENVRSRDTNWLLIGAIDKPTYFVAKTTNATKYLDQYPLKELYRKNGFVFMKRASQDLSPGDS